MKSFERIFLYSVLVILFFYVFLVDVNVESQVAIQEEIRARNIKIVNNEGQEVVELFTDAENNGAITVLNKDGIPVAELAIYEDDGMIRVGNKEGSPVAFMGITEYGGIISVANRDGNPIAGMAADVYGGTMDVLNRDGHLVAFLGTDKYGGIISVRNKVGSPVAGIGAEENGSGMIDVFDKDGKELVGLP